MINFNLYQGIDIYFYYLKEWIDREDNIANVYLHYTWTNLGHYPSYFHQIRHMTPLGNGRREKVIKLPYCVNGQKKYWFFHFFEVEMTNGYRWKTEVCQEEISDWYVEYIDHKGTVTNLCCHWSINDWSAPKYTPMDIAEIGFWHPFSSLNYYPSPNKEAFMRKRNEIVTNIPTPHIYRGEMRVPKGAKLIYCFHVGRMGSIDSRDDFEIWDTNNGRNWEVYIP